jgi:drug/metabolite transporter (DMT)-like permease
VIWYAALKDLTTTQAALLQLTIPIIAALGGVVFLAETITTRLIIAGILIICGVMVALVGKRFFK